MSGAGGESETSGSTCRVIAGHQASFPQRLVFSTGEALAVEDKKTLWEGWIWCVSRDGVGAWVPESFVERRGASCVALRDYDSTELTVAVGDILQAQDEASGWLWCRDGEGQWGWVPACCVEPL